MKRLIALLFLLFAISPCAETTIDQCYISAQELNFCMRGMYLYQPAPGYIKDQQGNIVGWFDPEPYKKIE